MNKQQNKQLLDYIPSEELKHEAVEWLEEHKQNAPYMYIAEHGLLACHQATSKEQFDIGDSCKITGFGGLWIVTDICKTGIKFTADYFSREFVHFIYDEDFNQYEIYILIKKQGFTQEYRPDLQEKMMKTKVSDFNKAMFSFPYDSKEKQINDRWIGKI